MSIVRPATTLLCCCFLLASCGSRPRPAAVFGTETGRFQASFDHYAINVDDLDRSVDWYRQVFGLEEITNGTGKDHIRWLSLGNGMSLHVIESDRSQLRLQKGVHLAIAVGEFDAFVDQLRELELPFESWQGEPLESNDRPDGVRQVYLKDPDGYWIEVNDGRLGWRKQQSK